MQKTEAGSLDLGLGFFFNHLPGVRRTPLFRFFFMVIRAEHSHAVRRRRTIPWSALKGERLLALQPVYPLQQLIDKHLAPAGVAQDPAVVLNGLPTLVAMAEAGEGSAIVPSFALPACQHDEGRDLGERAPIEFMTYHEKSSTRALHEHARL